MTRSPKAAGCVEVLFRVVVAHFLEGVPAVAEVADAAGEQFEFTRLDFGAILFMFEVAQFGREPVDVSIEPLDLCDEGANETPE